MFRKQLSAILLFIFAVAAALSAQTAKRPFKLDDLARLRDVRDPQLSPDGQWVAYVVATIDAKDDKGNLRKSIAKKSRRDYRSPQKSICAWKTAIQPVFNESMRAFSH